VSELPPGAAAGPCPSTAPVHLDRREDAPGGVVEAGFHGDSAAGDLLQSNDRGDLVTSETSVTTQTQCNIKPFLGGNYLLLNVTLSEVSKNNLA
jgi:hypothetical protein